jgi:hypothetical protein
MPKVPATLDDGHPVLRLPGHFDVSLGFQQRAQAGSNQRVIVGNEHPDLHDAGTGISTNSWVPPPGVDSRQA